VRPANTAHIAKLLRFCLTLATFPGIIACRVTGQRPVNDPRGATEPLSTTVLRAVGVPAPLAAVRPEMTYAELVRARPASQPASGIGREEQVAGWLAWYFFDSPEPPPGTPLSAASAEPDARQPMRRAEFRPLFIESRDGGGLRLWQEAVARARSVVNRVACYRFRIGGWTEKDEKEGVKAYVSLDDASQAVRRRIVIGMAGPSERARARRSARDPLGPPVAFVVTAEVEPIDDVFSLLHTERLECPAASAGTR
jgi:hypothetical protein